MQLFISYVKNNRNKSKNAIWISAVLIAVLLLIGLSFRENVTTARYAMDDMTSSLAKGENIFYAVDAFCREIADGVE